MVGDGWWVRVSWRRDIPELLRMTQEMLEGEGDYRMAQYAPG